MIKIIVSAIIISILIFGFCIIIYYDYQQEKRHKECINTIYSICVQKILNKQQIEQEYSWSVSDYLDRIESESLKIVQEKDTQDEYSLILWWGLDGLKMREDGIFDWIRKIDKTKEKSKPIECEKPTFQSQISVGFNQLNYRNVYYQPKQSIIQHPETEYLAKLLEQQNRNRINELNDKINSLRIQAAQQEQNQKIINQIRYTCVEGICKNK